jgi:dsRNA-specific ribonuclease
MQTSDHFEIEKKLEYEFRSKHLLEEALRHSSFVNEQPEADLRDNERFEFLGDAVLNLIVGHILMERYPNLKVRLGKGEIQTNGRDKNSILAGAFEALIAALYLDGGFKGAFKIIENIFVPLLDSVNSAIDIYDYKSQLQEWAQEEQGAMPHYKVVREEGPDHDKIFWISVKVFDVESEEGHGKSKKMAEQDAAKKALEILKKESP